MAEAKLIIKFRLINDMKVMCNIHLAFCFICRIIVTYGREILTSLYLVDILCTSVS